MEPTVATLDTERAAPPYAMSHSLFCRRHHRREQVRHLTFPIGSGRYPDSPGAPKGEVGANRSHPGKRCTPFAATVSLTVHGAK
jgi:hypothetical protein